MIKTRFKKGQILNSKTIIRHISTLGNVEWYSAKCNNCGHIATLSNNTLRKGYRYNKCIKCHNNKNPLHGLARNWKCYDT